MGCGLNWENNSLYKVADTKVGTLIAEIMREFMEHLRMDYSLSVFIPECSISPERLNKEEILSKCGIKNPQLFQEMPLMYYVLYFFIYNLISNPENEKFFADIDGKEIEKNSEQIIENNLRNYYAQKSYQNDNIEEVQLKEDIKPNITNNTTNTNNMEKAEQRKEQQQESKPKEKKKKSMTEDDLDSGSGKRNKSLEFEDYSSKQSGKNKLDNFGEKQQTNVESSQKPNDKNFSQTQKNFSQNHNINNAEEIDEEIMVDIEESNENFSDKRFIGSANSISQSGPDFSVNSKDLEKKYQYIEQVQK